MIRIALIVIRVLWILPYWMFVKIRRYKDVEKYSLEERYRFIYSIVGSINRKGRVEVKGFGMDLLPKESGYLLAPNHQGLEDPVAIFQTHQRPVRAIVKKELLKAPIVKDVIEMLEFFPMDRSDVRGSVKIIKEASKAIEQGQNIFVFPEGTRSRNKNNILEFKSGTFKIAINAKAPIVPVAIIDSYKVFDVNSLKKITVQIHYLEPIYYEDYKDLQTNDIAMMVHDQIEDCIKKHER